MVSSFRLWYCTESSWPALMCRILPTYRSERAQIVSCPHGFGTRVTGTRPELAVALPVLSFFAMTKYRASTVQVRACFLPPCRAHAPLATASSSRRRNDSALHDL